MTYGSPFEMDEHLWMIEEALEDTTDDNEDEDPHCPICGAEVCATWGQSDLQHLMHKETEAEYAMQAYEANGPTLCFDDHGFCPGCEAGIQHNHFVPNPDGFNDEVPF